MPPPAQFSLVDSLKNEARSSEEPPADRQAQSECLALFNLIDEDRSGQISKKEFLDAIRDNKEVKQYVYQSGTLGRLIATGDFEEAFLKLDVGGAEMDKIAIFRLKSFGNLPKLRTMRLSFARCLMPSTKTKMATSLLRS